MKSKGSKSFRKWRARVSSSSLLIWHCLQSDLSGILRIASLARTSLQKKHKEVKTDSISPKPTLPSIPLQPESSTQHHPKKVCKFLWLKSYHFLCPESHLCPSIYQIHACYKWPAQVLALLAPQIPFTSLNNLELHYWYLEKQHGTVERGQPLISEISGTGFHS